jgi:hypothetical protein
MSVEVSSGYMLLVHFRTGYYSVFQVVRFFHVTSG